jgi:hypothetical protein
MDRSSIDQDRHVLAALKRRSRTFSRQNGNQRNPPGYFSTERIFQQGYA